VVLGRDDRVVRLLDDLKRMGVLAAGIRAKGQAAYFADGIDGQTLRLAGRQVVIQVATVAEKLPESFRAQHPDIAWAEVRGMRNLVAHHDDKVQDRFIWDALGFDIPEIIERLGPAAGSSR
jgi:hypothetical protein